MASWSEFAGDAPEFADRVLTRFKAGANSTLATVRRDGAPRISATEALFRLDIAEAALIYLEGGELVIESWHPGRSYERRTRAI